MTKSTKNTNSQKNNGLFGPFGPSSSIKTTMGVDPGRISNSRPSTVPAAFPLGKLSTRLAGGTAIGRHFFAAPVNESLLPVNALVNVPNKDIGFVVTNQHANCIASQTTVSEKTSNGRKRIEVCLPYYDFAALETIGSQNPSMASIAPVGSMKVGVDIHAGGILTGTDGTAMLQMDELLVLALEDLVASVKLRQQAGQPLLSAAGYGVIPATVPGL